MGARSTLAIEDGAALNTAYDARIGNGTGPGETDTLSPKATVTGSGSQWNVGRTLTLYGDLDVLNGERLTLAACRWQASPGRENRRAGYCGRGLALYQRQQRERGRLRQWRAVCD
ncbi:hypothetical protein ACVXG7_06430 [Enterobacter hormaechei]